MNTESIKQNVRSRFDHNRNKQILAEKYESKMIFAYDGGMWKASPILISTLSAFTDDIMYLKDEYGTPVELDRSELLDKSKVHWQEQMNAWHNEFTELSRKR